MPALFTIPSRGSLPSVSRTCLVAAATAFTSVVSKIKGDLLFECIEQPFSVAAISHAAEDPDASCGQGSVTAQPIPEEAPVTRTFGCVFSAFLPHHSASRSSIELDASPNAQPQRRGQISAQALQLHNNLPIAPPCDQLMSCRDIVHAELHAREKRSQLLPLHKRRNLGQDCSLMGTL